jgi:hypothetical protein
METLVVALLVFVVGWQILQLREKGVAPAIKTLLRVSVESEEKDELFLPKEHANLRMALTLRVPLLPGMELDGHGAERSWKVARSVATDDGLVVFLSTLRVPVTAVQNEVKGLQRVGWAIDG